MTSMPEGVTLEQLASGQQFLQISHPSCQATMFLHGAHITHWQPTGEKPVIFLSEKVEYPTNSAIRGGIPICWPWFGASKIEGLNSHGYARNQAWQLANVSSDIDAVVVTMVLDNSAKTPGYPHDALAKLTVVFGKTLEIKLDTTNAGEQPLPVTQALHTYFNVADIHNTKVTGLEHADYVEKGERQAASGEAITFNGETDRVYYANNANTEIDDGERKILVRHRNTGAVVVWNPWRDIASGLSGMQESDYQQMLCVETANALADEIMLASGSTHSIAAHIEVL
ncbi:D-hexose-6-phosphate mutarotase [Salinibius halmophilus]|uniref:D-hexose-6-phosphate mutarotase n=1 Tax=Salinibius halmophilus TaxID=1853216 RepID=UPI000E666622|nr:D-hexose-6-phosphate mutarotase [Salinibius halmophilus]